VLVVVACYESREQTRALLARFPEEREYDLLAVDDGSRDGTDAVLRDAGVPLIRHERNRGLGAALKTGLRQALSGGYDVAVIMAGNDKDDPHLIPRLLEPILRSEADYVQGSRFLEGGSHRNLPLSRNLLVRLHARALSWLTRTRLTDAVNGFRAYRLALLADPRIDVWQDWLDRYELESYLHYKVLTLGYRLREVPVSKTYPARGVKYSHIRPFVDWWSILRPVVLLVLGRRR
jgi:dolichol-phosphate mannosyltransferase